VRNAARDLRRFTNILVVFPHPDDETVTCGGVIRRFADAGATVTLLLLTGGERGTPTGAADNALKTIRRGEADRAARILGITRVIHQDFGDSRLDEQREQVMPALVRTIAQIRPDLILTYDLAGLDGHPDHVACSAMLTELKTSVLNVPMWYVTLPGWVLGVLRLIGQMARDPAVDANRALPTHRLFIGAAVVPKLRAWQAHRSQREAIRKGLSRLVPTWLAVSGWPFEYFAELS
jgi:LmbE family N-acetylglucosaminyl deacetylase